MTFQTFIPDLRVEIAFNAGVRTPAGSRTWTDVSDYVELADEVQITGGRSDEKQDPDANTLSLTFDNTDGRFTPDNAAWAYYPDVLVGRPIRVTALYPPASEANLMSLGNADFESGVGSWTAGGTVPPTLAASATQAYNGSQSLRITWGTGGVLPLAQLTMTGLTIGETYTFAPYVYVPTGSPHVLTAVGGGIGVGPTSTVRDQWVRLTQTFVATATSHAVQIWPATSPTAGQLAYVDGILFVHSGEVGQYNTLTPIESVRFLGNIDAWPASWPQGEDGYSAVRVTATSRMARMGASTAQLSLLQQTILADSPYLYWPLGEPQGATSAVSLGSNTTPLQVITGDVTFGDEHGPVTDESTAALFLDGEGQLRAKDIPAATSWTFECLYQATHKFGSGSQELLNLTDGDTAFVVSAQPISAALYFIGLAAADTVPHTLNPIALAPNYIRSLYHVAVTYDDSTGTAELFINGASVASDVDAAFNAMVNNMTFKIGLVTATEDDAGAISHAAFFTSVLSPTTIETHYDAACLGFLDDTPGDRLDRYAALGGITDTAYETGSTTLQLANVDLTGRTVISGMRVIANTDGGVLYDARGGTHTYQALASRYTATAAVTLSFLDGELGVGDLTYDRAYLINQSSGTYPGGETPKIEDTASVDELDPAFEGVELASDYEGAYGAAAWLVSRYAWPRLRVPQLELRDITHIDPTKLAAVLGLDVGSMITTEDWPDQAPATNVDLFVEGYAETFRLASHTMTLNVSPAAIWTDVFILGSSLLGGTDVLAR